MKRLTEREIARLLAARATPEPPPGLADRIKAEIPGSIHIERAALQPTRRWLLPPLVDGLQPSWLAAASVLLVLGVGIVAARIPTQPDEVWKWMALSGVVHIDDIVVTALAPVEADRAVVASAKAVAPRANAQPAQRTAKGVAAERRADLAMAPLRPPDTSEVSGTAAGRDVLTATDSAVRTGVAGGAPVAATGARAEPAEAAEAMAAARVAQATVQESREPVAASRPAPPVGRRAGALAAPGPAECRDCLTVVVLDGTGAPLPGASVTLERIGQGGTWSLAARTDADGAATFRDVALSMYHVLVTAPSCAPTRAVVTVTSATQPTRTEVRVRPAGRR